MENSQINVIPFLSLTFEDPSNFFPNSFRRRAEITIYRGEQLGESLVGFSGSAHIENK